MDMTHPTQLEKHDRRIEGLFVREVSPVGIQPRCRSIVMIHGGCHGWWAFDPWLDIFAGRGWKSYAFSLRNHTDSYAVPLSEFLRLSVADYVKDTLTVLEHIPPPVVLVGHSMGGIVAQKVAERVDLDALVLVSSVGPGQLGKMRDPLPEDQAIILPPDQVKDLWFHRIDQDEFDAIFARLVPESPSVVNEYSSGKVPIDRNRIGCPVLVVGGACDNTAVHPPKAIADFFNGDLLVIPDAGHDLMLEPAHESAAIRIDRWLMSTLAGSNLP